ncbi:Ubiquinone/menaquinone biosynthesis C-methyltransferase UbiE [Mariniflexile rhizosphaerae]|uniref:class I SAM-dependent methyltransferase n=1 Tax=unclassified Mariniflexile TaxID=2643887 RepID=UPI000CCB4F4D|nr:methyltransferase domain-containing protein [Mariniflexile sp. TRM1-10]AXP79927.1 Ubiquinone/menaquinone biosynthesis C-methyltransferase UbiE [Mariniflexile sp. TRM1-10]PLB21070.1 MAG: Methyltransferase type 11 [Flavobacteriaceae bacterium FS1-H7996/R]
MEIKRKKFQGVLNILSFNRHFYIYGITALVLITISYLMYNWSNTLFWLIITAFIYGLIMPLIVSAYVYDFSGYYNFNWLKKLNIKDSNINKFININAGFDETSFIIKSHFIKSDLKVFDFYNEERHTEPAIIRARKVSLVYPETKKIKSDVIPLKDKSVDVIFLLSAAHEIRNNQERIQFLKECHRLCKPNGRVIMVEHLRDFPNFLAFSIGFTHFFSKNTWKKAFKSAGFSTFNEAKFTPFMSVFNCLP